MTSHLIDGKWIDGRGEPLVSTNPATGESVWQGRCATDAEVGAAVLAARKALPAWSHTCREKRIDLARRFAHRIDEHGDALAQLISDETGKALWEAKTEVGAMSRKVSIAIDALRTRTPAETRDDTTTGFTHYKPLGTLCVIGPFNFPGHLPNGHITPALLAGNTVVFKPSEQAPAVAAFTVRLWQQAGLPDGVLNLIQGGAGTSAALVVQPDHQGILFTGSLANGLAIRRALVDHPEKITALEMGGSNPLIAWDAADANAAAYLTLLSAYLTAGQRCSCARRWIIPKGDQGDRYIAALLSLIKRMRIGLPADRPEPFFGPLISAQAALRAMESYQRLLDLGAVPLEPMQQKQTNRCPALLTPGLIDVTYAHDLPDQEIFAPLLQVIRANDFDDALAFANGTAFGLVASLASDRRDLFDRFFQTVNAGVINFNRPTTGASARLPFGGLGKSGNHRPAGYFAADYCAVPIATTQSPSLTQPDQLATGINP